MANSLSLFNSSVNYWFHSVGIEYGAPVQQQCRGKTEVFVENPVPG